MNPVLSRLKDVLAVPPCTPADTAARLASLAARTPRYRHGSFPFQFGLLRYVDALSLRWQYVDLFINGAYDFSCAHEEPVILDCGANVGLSIMAFKRRYPRARITAFEADPAIAEILASNLSAAGAADVKVVNAAVWVSAGSIAFTRDGADSGRVDPGGDGVAVPAVRLADAIDGRIDLLKLDIEGAEYAVIDDLGRGGKLKYVERLFCEVHGRPGDKDGVARILTTLVAGGFTFCFGSARSAPDLVGPAEPTPFPFVRDGRFLLHLYAWRPELACAS